MKEKWSHQKVPMRCLLEGVMLCHLGGTHGTVSVFLRNFITPSEQTREDDHEYQE